MSQNENTREDLETVEPEQIEESEPALERDDPEYVPRAQSTRILAWILIAVMVVGILLYYGWISGILHE